MSKNDEKLRLVELGPGLRFSLATLKEVLPDIEVTLFFAKLYELDSYQLGRLLHEVHGTDVIAALTGQAGAHSSELQDYVVDLGYEYLIDEGVVVFDTAPPHAEILPELWKSLEVDVAKSIKEVAEKLRDVVGAMPGKEGQMVFRSLMTVNAKRPVLGDYRASVYHAPARENLVVLDVSGSMSETTITTIIDDVVALSWAANAHLAIVSDTATHWQPGEYGTQAVLSTAEFSGTHYETLSDLFDRDWGVVVTIADYDSSPAAKRAISACTGSIEQLLDISLVNRPTYLAEVLGQLAKDVRPLLVADYDLTSSSW